MMQRREEILNAAMDLFFKYGLMKLTLKDIARNCGIQNTAIYYYFKDKENLVKTVIKTFFDGIKEKVEAALSEEQTLRYKLKNYIKMRTENLAKGKKFVENFRQDDIALSYRKYAIQMSEEFIVFEIEKISSLIESGIKDGCIKNIDIPSLCVVIIGATEGLMYRNIFMEEEMNLDKEIDSILDIIFKGISN